MDIAQFLADSGRVGGPMTRSSGSGSDQDTDVSRVSGAQMEAEPESRRRGYKRPSLHFTDRKALRAIRVEERRRGVRDNIHLENRGINRNEHTCTFDEDMEDRENSQKDENIQVTKKAEAVTKPEEVKDKAIEASARMLEKLKKYKEDKRKLEEMRKRQNKPAFKVGVVHHPLAPFGSGSSGVERGADNTSRCHNTLTNSIRSAAVSKATGSSRAANTTASSTANITANTTARSRQQLARTNASSRIRAGVATRPAAGRALRAGASRTGKAAAEPPKIMVDPPAERFTLSSASSGGSSSQSSTGSVSSNVSTRSFAPEGFRFSLQITTTVKKNNQASTPLDGKKTGMSSLNMDAIPMPVFEEQMEEDVFEEGQVQQNAPPSAPRKSPQVPAPRPPAVTPAARGRRSTRNSSHATGTPSSVGSSEIDLEISHAVLRNLTAKKMERRGLSDSRISEEEEEDTRAAPTTPGLRPILPTHLPIEQAHLVRLSPIPRQGRSRTRRVSGVQPDPTISPESLAKTPARRAKERSLSSTRRSVLCTLCVEGGEHSHESDSGTTVTARPYQTPRVSRKSRLPLLDETSPSQESEDGVASDAANKATAQRQARRSTRASTATAQTQVTGADSTDEEQEKSAERPDRRRRSSRKSRAEATPTERRRSTRRIGVAEEAAQMPIANDRRKSAGLFSKEESSQQELTDEMMEVPVQPSPAVNKTMETLSSELMAASLESARKVLPGLLDLATTEQVGTPPAVSKLQDSSVFKTPTLPFRSARKAKSAIKNRVSPLLDGSPWINTEKRSSAKRKYSMSEEKPKKSDISSLFDDISDDPGSPMHVIIAKRVKSADNIDEISETNWATTLDFDAAVEKDSEESTAQESSTAEVSENIAGSGGRMNKVRSVDGQEECEHDVPYFRNLLASETKRLTELCNRWEAKISSAVPEDCQGQIRSVVGQGRLVMDQRFKQFSGLVDNCEFGSGEKPTSCMDLQGFWEMIYFQVEDVDAKFVGLLELEENGWREKEAARKPAILQRKRLPSHIKKSTLPGASGQKKSSSGSEEKRRATPPQAAKRPNIKQLIAARRAALAAANGTAESSVTPQPTIQVEGEAVSAEAEEEKTFQGGFFSIKSPIRPCTVKSSSADNSPVRSGGVASKSTGGDRLRRTVLTESARRVSGLVSPYVSNMARRSLSAAPTSPGTSALRRATLFDDVEDMEEEITDKKDAEEAEKVEVEVVDPVCPLSSPVTKTYSKLGGSPAAEQQRRDLFDQVLISPSHKSTKSPDPVGLDQRYFLPSTPSAVAEFTPLSTRLASTSSEDEVPAAVVGMAEESRPTAPSLKSAWSTGSGRRRTRQSVKFTPQLPNDRESGGSSVVSTPHPLRKKKETPGREDATTPRLRPRVSLLPGMEKSPTAVAELKDDFMSFESPSPSPSAPSRRSMRHRNLE